MNPFLLRLALSNPNHLLDNVLMGTDENMRAWARVEELLNDIADRCDEIGARLMIVVFPRSIQINRSHFEFFEKLTLRLDDRTLQSDKPQRLLRDYCDRRGLPCLDLLPVLKGRSEEEFYRDKDDHLNDVGNRLASDRLMEFFRSNDVLSVR